MTKDFVITGVAGYRNRGIEAFTLATINAIHARWADARITVASHTPEYDALRVDDERVEFVQDGHIGLRAAALRPIDRVVPSRVAQRVAPAYQDMKRRIKAASALVVLGGDIFSSTYENFSGHLVPLSMARRYGVPQMMLGHSIGWFDRSGDADEWCAAARETTAISIREHTSLDYIESDLGFRHDRMVYSADPAFLMDPVSPDAIDRLMTYYGCESGEPVIGLGVSQGIKGFAGLSSDDHHRAWMELINVLLRETDARILLIAHTQDVDTRNDDRIAVTQLARSLEFDPRISMVTADHSAREFKGILSRCDLVVSERMHASIGALSSGVPAVAISYSIKADGIMADLFTDPRYREMLTIPSAEFASGDGLGRIREAWADRDQIRHALVPVAKAARESANVNYDVLKEILN